MKYEYINPFMIVFFSSREFFVNRSRLNTFEDYLKCIGKFNEGLNIKRAKNKFE